MATQNGVIETATGDLLRAAPGVDFTTDGSFDSDIETFKTDVPFPANVRPNNVQEYESVQFYNFDGNTWNLKQLTPIAGLPKNYVNGLELTRDSNSQVTIEIGDAKSKDDILDIELENKIQLDITKSGAGGLDTGSESASKWLATHILGKETDTTTGINTSTSSFKLINSAETFIADDVNVGDIVFNIVDGTQAKVNTIDSETQLTLDTDIFTGTGKTYIVGPKGIGILSLSETSPTLPTGYIYSRRVGYVRNDSTSNFISFFQHFNNRTRKYFYDEALADLAVLINGSATTPTEIDCSNFMPPTSQLGLFMFAFETGSSGSGDNLLHIRRVGMADGGMPFTFGVGVKSTQKARWSGVEIPTDSAQKIEYKVDSGANNQATIAVIGFTDEI